MKLVKTNNRKYYDFDAYERSQLIKIISDNRRLQNKKIDIDHFIKRRDFWIMSGKGLLIDYSPSPVYGL